MIGHSLLVPWISGETPKDRHRRRAEAAFEREASIQTWCDFRNVSVRFITGARKVTFRKDFGYAAWDCSYGWLKYCPDWRLQPNGPTRIKVNDANELLEILGRLWLQER